MTETPTPKPTQENQPNHVRLGGTLLGCILSVGIGLLAAVGAVMKAVAVGFGAGGESIPYLSLVISPFCGLLNGLLVGLCVFFGIRVGQRYLLDRRPGRLDATEEHTWADSLQMGAKWFLGTSAAATVGIVEGNILLFPLTSLLLLFFSSLHLASGYLGELVSYLPLAALTGGLVGFTQWIILHRTIKRAGWWIPATIISYTLAWLVGFPVSEIVGSPIAGVVGGMVIGAAQWLVLQQAGVKGAEWWIPSSVVAWAGSFTSGSVLVALTVAAFVTALEWVILRAPSGFRIGMFSALGLLVFSTIYVAPSWVLSTSQKIFSEQRIWYHSPIGAIAFTSDGRALGVGVVKDSDTVAIRAAVTGEKVFILRDTGYGDVERVALSPDGRILAVRFAGFWNETVQLWDIADEQFLYSLPDLNFDVLLAFSPDGRTLASGLNATHTVKLWDVATGQELQTLIWDRDTHLFDTMIVIAFSPDSTLLTVAGRNNHIGTGDGVIMLWDVSGGKELRTIRVPEIVLSVAVSPDGQILASGGRDDIVRLWDVASGQELRALQGHTAPVRSLAFSPDGRILASGSWDDTIMLWDVSTGQALHTLEGHTESEREGVEVVAFSPDGRILASGARNGELKLWDVATGQELSTANSEP